LSTGLRINTGKDDPAGLIASEALRSDITSINKAISNTRRATQIIATADSALGQVSSLLNDVRGLVVEAANTGALSEDEIAANQLQVDSSLAAINRIAQTTTFQGRKLLDGSLDFTVSSGTNFTSLTNIQINQANLGSTNTVNLSVEISSAATRAEVELLNLAESNNGTGTITLSNIAADAEAGTGSLTTIAGADYQIDVKDGTSLDGTAGNDVTVSIASGATAVTGQAATATQATAAGDFTVSAAAGGAYDGAAGNDVDVTIVAGNTATAQSESAAQDVNGVTGAFTVSAKAGGAFDGAAGNVLTVEIESGTGTSIAEAAGVVTITVDNTNSVSLDNIAAALAGNADFEFNVTAGLGDTLFRNDGSDDLTVLGATDFGLNGQTSGTDAVATYNLDTSGANPELTITVNDNTDETLSNIKAALEADFSFANDFQFNVGVDDVFRGSGLDNASNVDLASGSNAAAEVTFVDNVLNITVDNSAPVALSAIEAALEAEATFSDFFDLNVTTDNNFADDGSDDISAAAFAGGTDTTTDDVITVTSADGAAANGTISIVQANGQGAPSAALDSSGNITITIDDTASTTLTDIVNAIGSNLSGYSAAITTSAGDETFNVATDAFATTDISGASDGGITDDVVFELGGESGSQVFQIAANTTIDELVAQVNLVSEATGVRAEADGTTFRLQSTTFGSDAKVDLRVIDEDDAGSFTSALGIRTLENGQDVVAKINGVGASGDGNTLKVNTATLDIALSVEADFFGTIDFTITGGGAQFQLGPEVVSNQQARIGIGSLNTAQLGGVAGKLYQLAEGGSASLSENTNLASEIVDSAINQVTSLRGRLGAFQATALESNLVSLNETVNNLTEAESSIRDADFAAESARLTRNQILVQSGTNVLALANQNPQNVLSLLR
jgi:flagellin